ncbi:MAG: hypothetical protein A2945_01445 [Candidatus Liptonbacteria bacterium RIFCSPLOWO2_01_FULL_52_25]|uniref:Uncharacterized protein n=1 Tax=Candidatus Liptonbacteria bacterium RIFCSPLOWO2_01_FULL_52_25 TaxID=1798650 RepID=A0A1G2CDP0_9BACT|nr:MAG: hypothetical protein A2945_01445 [Candidatus Liptonbacteria bacterium RIFCSPLOWO2_01_FULL_52_25]
MAEHVFFVFLAVLDLLYIDVVLEGRSLHAQRKMQLGGAPSHQHQWSAYIFLFWLVFFVSAIETYVWMIGGSVFDPLLGTHLLVFAGPLSVVLYLLVRPFNGERSLRYHRRLARLSIALVVGLNITGILLIHLRF